MKKVLFPILALVLALGLALPMATPAEATSVQLTIVSDATNDYWDRGLDGVWGTGDDGWVSAVPCWVHPSWPSPASLSGATWIWRVNQVNPATEYNTLPPAGYRTFQKQFTIPSSAVITSGSITINADNAYELRINGSLVDNEGAMSKDGPDNAEWKTVRTTACTSDLQTGPNTIEIRAIGYFNWGTYQSNPAGVIYKLTVDYEIPDIEKSVAPSSGTLGDHLTVTLDVENPYDRTLTVTDTIPAGLGFIPGTLRLNGVLQPNPVGDTISVTIPAAPPSDHTVTFDVQVVETPSTCDGAVIVTNTAYLKDGITILDQDSEDITIDPYEDFEKTATLVYDEDADTIMEVGELLQWDMTISFINPLGVPINATIYDRLGGDLGMAGDLVDNDRDGTPDPLDLDLDPGDLPMVYNVVGTGNLQFFKITGKTNKVQYSITDNILGGATVQYTLGIFTDHNPAKQAPGKQEYTDDGIHWLNSGAVIKFIDPGTLLQLSAHTCSLYVDVVYPD